MSSRESYYEVLGLSPGATAREVKDAYRDLAKVWHPDRFAHDPRLQQKAQEKLKEINEAYKELTSGSPSAPRRSPAPPPSPDARRARDDRSHADASDGHQLSPSLTILLALVVAGAALFVGLRLMRPTPAPARMDPRPQAATADDGRDAGVAGADSQAPTPPARAERRQNESPRRAEAEPRPDAPPAGPAPRPLPTVQRTIDPETGLLARTDCPLKAARTYAAGEEPRQFCAAAHARR